MSKQNWDYIHGYTNIEQERLIQQAQYWRNNLILRELNYQSGDKLLEIGCGAGAVLGILGTAFPGIKISGIDLETKQIIIVTPESADYRYLQDGLCELLLQSGGNPYIGQTLGNLLSEAGFNNVENQALTFHYYSSKDRQKLQEFIAYVESWLAPTVPLIAEKLGKDKTKLNAGLEWFRSIGDRDNGAATVVVYRVSATK